MEISTISLGGLQTAETQFNKAASDISQSFTSGADTVDLSASAVSMLSAKNSYSANIAVLKVADDMTKATLDLLG